MDRLNGWTDRLDRLYWMDKLETMDSAELKDAWIDQMGRKMDRPYWMDRLEYWYGMDGRIGGFDRWMADRTDRSDWMNGWTGQTAEDGWTEQIHWNG